MMDQQRIAEPGAWPVACLGPGRVGTALTRALAAAGYPIAAVGGGSAGWAERLAEQTGARVVASPYRDLGALCRLVVVTTPDHCFEQIAAELGNHADLPPGSCLLHASATEPAEVLRPAAGGRSGIACVCLHPIRPFPDRHQGPDLFRGCLMGAEGTGWGYDLVVEIARRLGGQVVKIPPHDKALYHAAGVMSANGVMALAWAGRCMAEQLGLGDTFYRQGLLRLMADALDAVHRQGLPEALTGPISRGDVETVRRHLLVLEERLPELAACYREIGRLVLALARQGERLSQEEGEALRQLLGE